ncbi:MAG: hypothetical protein K1X75_00510 [Leptospirales bacterium]|nr:hypothetical protein [Leptospirales bacterium]
MIDPRRESASSTGSGSVDQGFHIYAPGVDSSAVQRRVEERLRRVGLSADEVDRVARLTLAPAATASELVFSAAAAIESFERPVPPPDFGSAKYRRLRGPLRSLAQELYSIFARLHERMMQNRAQAFHKVVQGMLSLQRSQAALRTEIEAAVDLAARAARGPASSATVDRAGAAQAPLLPEHEAACLQFLEVLGDPPEGPWLILSGRNSGMRLRLSKGIPADFQEMNAESLQLQPGPEGGFACIALLDAGNYRDLPLLAAQARRLLKRDGALLLFFDEGVSAAPFVPRSQWLCPAPANLVAYMELHGLERRHVAAPAGFRTGSLSAVFCRRS